MVTLTSLTVLSHWARDVDLSVESLQKECASTKLVVLKNIGKQNSHHIIQGEVQESLKQWSWFIRHKNQGSFLKKANVMKNALILNYK